MACKAWLEGMAPSARVIHNIFLVFIHRVRLNRYNTINQLKAIKLLTKLITAFKYYDYKSLLAKGCAAN